MLVDNVDNGHRADKEEQRLTSLAKVVDQVLSGFFYADTKGVNRPYRTAHKKRRGGFVDSDVMLEGYTRISQEEYQYDCYNHC